MGLQQNDLRSIEPRRHRGAKLHGEASVLFCELCASVVKNVFWFLPGVLANGSFGSDGKKLN